MVLELLFFFFQQEQVLKHVLKLPLKPCVYDFDSMSFTLKYTTNGTIMHTRVLYIHILTWDTRGVIVGADAESLQCRACIILYHENVIFI